MGRRPIVNDVPVASFSLIGVEPISTQAAYERLGKRRYIAARGAEVDPRATLDPALCTHCGAKVEWAYTFKRDPTHAKGGENYVYARCTLDPKSHRWGFRNSAETPHTVAEPTPNPTHTEEPPAMTTNAPAAGSLDAVLTAIVDQRVGARITDLEAQLKDLAKTAQLDPDAIKAMVEAATNSARRVEITIPAMPQCSYTGKAHPVLAQILKLIAAGVRYFYVAGPASSGKSTLARQVAEALKRPLTCLAMNETIAREEILGSDTPNITTGERKYTPSAFVSGWLAGHVLLVDEADRGNANTLVCFNSIEQNALYIPRSETEGGSVAQRHEKTVLILTANTYGTGASRTYVGANQLDAAFLDRFYPIEVDYNRDLEIEITGSPDAVAMLWDARTRANDRSVRRPLTTRMAKRAVIDATLAGKTDRTGIREAFVAQCKASGWTQTEISGVWAV